MIAAEITGFHSPDIDDLALYVPDIPDTFGFFLQIMAGPSGTDAQESFDVMVCTPSWLLDRIGSSGVLMGRHHLLMRRYDYPRLNRYLHEYVATCVGNNWREVAEKLGRIGKWEFEDYRPYRPEET